MTLVLIPGLLCDDTVWSHQRAALAAAGPVHVADHGALDSLTDMAARVLERVTAPRIAVVGHSMGARVAMEMLRLAPQRVAGVALLDSSCHALPAGEAGEAERDGRQRLVGVARAQGMRAMGREWARGMVHPSRLDTPLFDAILDMIERRTPEVFEAQVRALLARRDASPELRALRAPTLLLCGREDAWSPPSRHEEMRAFAPHARLEIVERCGHMSTMEQPQAVTAALARWLAEVPIRAPS